ncbi:MAG: hypothetical protein JXX14_00910 [Deltaproteobacteria bacterium]|nr:hypothetical protein [Deltaproteobacteria bacterium]
MERESKCITKEQQGAVMVMALFMGVFLCALLYHIVGVGQSAVENQLAQDATDSLTFSAAAIKARGMNTIALINDIMAIVLSILVALKLLQMVIAVAIAAVAVACVFVPAVCGAISPLGNWEHTISNMAREVENSIKPVLKGLETAAEAVNKATPVLAEVEAVYISQRESGKVSQAGFVWPIVDELPTEPGSFSELCKKAGEKVGDVALSFLPGDAGKDVRNTVSDLIGKLAGKFPDYFCGDGDKPKSSMKQDTAYPNSTESCDLRSDTPDMVACSSGICQECAQLACEQCIPKMNRSGFKKAKWRYVKETWEETRDEKGVVIEKSDSHEDESVTWLKTNPCKGQKGVSCSNNHICQIDDEALLHEYYVPDPSGTVMHKRVQIQVTRIIYEKIHTCIVEEEYQLDAGKPMDAKGMGKPRQLKKDATDDDFRVWGIGLGKNSQEARKINVGRMYGQKPSGIQIGERFTAASADFKSPDNDLWSMKWYARMIRFRMPKSGLTGDACKGDRADKCRRVSGGLSGVSKKMEELIVH